MQMPEREHLPNAPITEALIDIRVEQAEEGALDRIRGFRDKLKSEFPNCRERRRFHGELTFGDAAEPRIRAEQSGPDGYLLDSADGLCVVQGRLDGFTYSRLKPYRDWKSLRDAARSLWRTYCETVHPSIVTRIALRYINRIELPMPVGDLKDWIQTIPAVAAGLPQELAGFLFRITVPFQSPEAVVHITETVGRGTVEKVIPLILDIDAFLDREFDVTDDAIWKRFEDLHKVKNTVFFKSVTEKTLELCR